MPIHTARHRTPISVVAFALLLSIGSTRSNRQVLAAPAPTCQSFGESWYFPNSCVADCTAQSDGSSTMDTDRSRNVNGDLKCYCTGRESPLCADDPMCSDLEILPGSAKESCEAVCGSSGGSSDVVVVDDVEYAGDASAANKNQTHFRVGCSCDGGATQVCGTDYVLFSDLTYLKWCTRKADNNSLQIKSAEACDAYCTKTNPLFDGGIWNDSAKSCACKEDSMEVSAVACDDSSANTNDGSGLGNPCYENVGVSTADCSSSSNANGEQPSTTQTLVSSAAIMGIWLLPW